MVNRRPSRDEGGGYSWMDTYGDMVTLLLTFFVLLFAFSSVNEDKWRGLVQAFTGTPPLKSIAAVDMLTLPDFSKDLPSAYLNLDGMLIGGKEAEADKDTEPKEFTPEQLAQLVIPVSAQQREVMQSSQYQQNEAKFSLLFERLVLYIQTNGLEDMLFASRDMESIYLRVAAGVLFESGKADIRPEALSVLDTLEEICYSAGDSLSLLSVEGHTDNVPIRTARFADNWELSSMRAINVVRYMLDKGRLTPDMFAFSGYGEYRPIATNDTEEGRQQNRRVEFVFRKRVITAADLTPEGEPTQVEKDVNVGNLPAELQEVPMEANAQNNGAPGAGE